MKRRPTTRIDSGRRAEIAQREGHQGDRRWRRDRRRQAATSCRVGSCAPTPGIELASFRETGDGPQGTDRGRRQARACASQQGGRIAAAGECDAAARPGDDRARSRRCGSTAKPSRANTIGDDRAIGLAREAVAIDSTFASAWSALAANLSNYGGSQSAIDSALTTGVSLSRTPARARARRVTARYFAMGPGRDRAKAIAAYEAILQRGDTTTCRPGEPRRDAPDASRVRARRIAERCGESASCQRNGTALGNAIEMQINQGKLKDAAAVTIESLNGVSHGYGVEREMCAGACRGRRQTTSRD